MLNIAKIKNGLVIDHIKSGQGLRIFNWLGLDKAGVPVAFIVNAPSKHMGKKDMLKIDETISIDYAVLGLIDPNITINVIENEIITEKIRLKLPERVENVLVCKNPRCVTQVERAVPQVFFLTDREKGSYRCEYCDESRGEVDLRALFKNARLVDEERDEVGDLLVEDGLIVGIGVEKTPRGLTLDCDGRVLMPSFVDLHVHFRDPGFLDKERLESGCLAAAAGGFGTVVAMANTRPATSNAALALATRARARELGLVDYLPVLTMTDDLGGRDLEHLRNLEAALTGNGGDGLRVLSDDGRDIEDDALLLGVFEYAAKFDLLAACHCDLAAAATAAASPMAADRLAEIGGVERAIRLARVAGCRLHLAHLSTRESVQLARNAKADARISNNTSNRFRITCEATPHHLALTYADAIRLGADGPGRVNPWLRDDDDRLAVLEGLIDGTIDAIATDHAPHTTADKAAGAPGFSGLETAFGLCHSALVKGGFLDLRRLSALMSASPAAVLGLADRGRLEVGLRADLVLVDPEAEWIVDPALFRSRGKNSAIAGSTLTGRVLMTMYEGRIVHDNFR